MNFRKGDRSDGVLAYKSLMRAANELGIVKSKVDSTNGFGDGTYKATLEIQKKYKLEVDAIAGVKTITALATDVIKNLASLVKAKGADRNGVLSEAISALDKLKT